MLRFRIYKIWIKRHCCPRKCLGNRCKCDSNLMIFKTNFHFSPSFFSFLISKLISALDCFYPVLDAENHFLGNESISCLKRSFPTISIQQIQNLLILFSCIHNSNLCFFLLPVMFKSLSVYEKLPLRFVEIYCWRMRMMLSLESLFTLKKDQRIGGNNMELYRNKNLCL